MSAKIVLSSEIKFIPQQDFGVRYTENGGIEAHQTFFARKSSLGTSDLALFQRGTLWQNLYPQVPSLYKNLSMKTFDPSDYAPGIISIDATFTGYQFAGNESSGNEKSVATSSLNPQIEEAPINEHPKFVKLDIREKMLLGKLLRGVYEYVESAADGGGYVMAKSTGDEAWTTLAESEQLSSATAKTFATLISQDRTTFKRPVWQYTYRTESEKGFTGAQLNKTGKIVSSPEGNPESHGAGWTWLLTGPSQEQSGPNRFFKNLDYLLIRDDADNQFLYGE